MTSKFYCCRTQDSDFVSNELKPKCLCFDFEMFPGPTVQEGGRPCCACCSPSLSPLFLYFNTLLSSSPTMTRGLLSLLESYKLATQIPSLRGHPSEGCVPKLLCDQYQNLSLCCLSMPTRCHLLPLFWYFFLNPFTPLLIMQDAKVLLKEKNHKGKPVLFTLCACLGVQRQLSSSRNFCIIEQLWSDKPVESQFISQFYASGPLSW